MLGQTQCFTTAGRIHYVNDDIQAATTAHLQGPAYESSGTPSPRRCSSSSHPERTSSHSSAHACPSARSHFRCKCSEAPSRSSRIVGSSQLVSEDAPGPRTRAMIMGLPTNSLFSGHFVYIVTGLLNRNTRLNLSTFVAKGRSRSSLDAIRLRRRYFCPWKYTCPNVSIYDKSPCQIRPT